MSINIAVVQQKSVVKQERPSAQGLGILTDKPKFPQYAVVEKRYESFKEWPKCPVSVETLVEAGLVYTGVGDSVRCYYCGGGLRNWESGDEPMLEHARWYPHCTHVRIVKGQAFIDAISKGETPTELLSSLLQKETQLENTDKTDTVDQEKKLLSSEACEAVRQMGFSEDDIKLSIKIYQKRNNGKTCFKGTDLAEILLDFEDNLSFKQEALNIVDSVPKPREDPPQDVDRLEEENNRLKEQNTCRICMDKMSDIIFLPCGHIVSCAFCAPALKKCPVCRKGIQGIVKAMFATIADVNH